MYFLLRKCQPASPMNILPMPDALHRPGERISGIAGHAEAEYLRQRPVPYHRKKLPGNQIFPHVSKRWNGDRRSEKDCFMLPDKNRAAGRSRSVVSFSATSGRHGK